MNQAARDLPIATIEKTPYGAAAIAGAVVFALYAITLAPTTAFWDTSEYIIPRGTPYSCSWPARGSCCWLPPGFQWRCG